MGFISYGQEVINENMVENIQFLPNDRLLIRLIFAWYKKFGRFFGAEKVLLVIFKEILYILILRFDFQRSKIVQFLTPTFIIYF